MKRANCLPISAFDAQRLYLEGREIAISENGFHTSERVQKELYPAPEGFFKQKVEYYLLLDEVEAKELKRFHFKALTYMLGGFLGLTLAINLSLGLYWTQHLNYLTIIFPLAISYMACYCFVSLREMADSAEQEYQKILKKYKLK